MDPGNNSTTFVLLKTNKQTNKKNQSNLSTNDVIKPKSYFNEKDSLIQT